MQSLTENSSKQDQQSTGSYPWILSPVLDYLFCCGGMMWLLFIIEKLGVDPSNTKSSASVLLAAVIGLGSVLITEAHGPATLVRAFASRTTPQSVKVATIVWAVILFVVAAMAVHNIALAQIFTKVTLVWLIQHYTAQTYGVIIIYCMKRDYKLSNAERISLQWLLRSLMLFVIVRMFTYYEYGHLDNFLGLRIPFYGPLPLWCLLSMQFLFTVSIIVFLCHMVAHYIRDKQFLPMPALVSIISVAMVTLSLRNAFFALGVTFYHASQYLAVTYSYYLKEKAEEKGRPVHGNILREFITPASLIYLIVISSTGFFFINCLPQGLIKGGLPETTILCILYSYLNCHHFFTDSILWRIRNPKVKELLV
jgi:hypothetical protein